jgi:diguanylate cyclase (GGDEF)-like protein/PAS domain S-box-containing protein
VAALRVGALLLIVASALAWVAAFPAEPSFDWGDAITELSYVLGIAGCLIFVTKVDLPTLEIGVFLFLYSLVLEFLDEFTVEPYVWGTWLPGGASLVGLTITIVGARMAVLRRRRETAERERAVEGLQAANSTLRAVIESTPDAISVRTLDGRFVLVNQAASRILGRPAVDLLGHTVGDVLPPVEAAATLDTDRQALETGEPVTYEETIETARGPRTYLVTKATYRNDRGDPMGIMRIGRDITERKLVEERLAHDARHDPLTGLPNRATFMDQLERVLARARRRSGAAVAVLFLDLDRFKEINDSLGHRVGDALLVAFSHSLEHWLRPGDLVARLGGDEFTVLLDDITGVEEARGIAERIERGLKGAFRLEGREVSTTASIGIAVAADDHDTAEQLLHNADLAMYQAKRLGRARHVVHGAAEA